jgi:hypothetical protein
MLALAKRFHGQSFLIGIVIDEFAKLGYLTCEHGPHSARPTYTPKG